MLKTLPKSWSEEDLRRVECGTFPFFEYELDDYTRAWYERDSRMQATIDVLVQKPSQVNEATLPSVREIADLKILRSAIRTIFREAK